MKKIIVLFGLLIAVTAFGKVNLVKKDNGQVVLYDADGSAITKIGVADFLISKKGDVVTMTFGGNASMYMLSFVTVDGVQLTQDNFDALTDGFNTIGSGGGGGASTWGQVTGKPFSSIGSGLAVVNDVLNATSAAPAWSQVTGKPFSSLGSGLTVTNDVLNTTSAVPAWGDVTDKPFVTIGSGLSVVNNALVATGGGGGSYTAGDGIDISAANVISVKPDTYLPWVVDDAAKELSVGLSNANFNFLSKGSVAGQQLTSAVKSSTSGQSLGEVRMSIGGTAGEAGFVAQYPWTASMGMYNGQTDEGANVTVTKDGVTISRASGGNMAASVLRAEVPNTNPQSQEYITKYYADQTYSSTPTWSQVTDKPFKTIGTNLSVTNDVLNAKGDVTTQQLKDTSTAIRGEFSKYAQLDGKNEFTASNVFKVRDSFLIRAATSLGDEHMRFKFSPSLLDGSLQSTFVSNKIEQTPAQLNLVLGRSVFEPDGVEASLKFTDVNAPKATLRADGGITLDGNTTISDGDKLQYGTTAATYPTPAANNEYITKGWTDATYPKYSNQGSKSFSFSDAGTNYIGALMVSDAAVSIGQEGVTNNKSASTNYLGGIIYNQVEDGLSSDDDYANNTFAIRAQYIEIDSPLVRTTSQTTAKANEFITKGYADATYSGGGGGGASTWSQVTGKPFSTVGSGLTVTNDVLSANAATWSSVTSKPFNSIGSGLSVANGVLSATGGGGTYTAGDGIAISGSNVISVKPETFLTYNVEGTKSISLADESSSSSGYLDISDNLTAIGSSSLSGTNNRTTAQFTNTSLLLRSLTGTDGQPGYAYNSISITPQSTTIDSALLRKTTQTTAKANEYITKAYADANYSGGAGESVAWYNVTGKPFATVGHGLVIKEPELGGILEATLAYPAWENVTDKPFKTVGDGLNVGGTGNLVTSWDLLPGKPFSTMLDTIVAGIPLKRRLSQTVANPDEFITKGYADATYVAGAGLEIDDVPSLSHPNEWTGPQEFKQTVYIDAPLYVSNMTVFSGSVKRDLDHGLPIQSDDDLVNKKWVEDLFYHNVHSVYDRHDAVADTLNTLIDSLYSRIGELEERIAVLESASDDHSVDDNDMIHDGQGSTVHALEARLIALEEKFLEKELTPVEENLRTHGGWVAILLNIITLGLTWGK